MQRISTVLTDDKISDEEFRLILSEIDKYSQMKEEIRGRQKQGVGLSEGEKNEPIRRVREEAMSSARTKLLSKLAPLLRHFLLAGVRTQSGQDCSIRIRINRAGEPL